MRLVEVDVRAWRVCQHTWMSLCKIWLSLWKSLLWNVKWCQFRGQTLLCGTHVNFLKSWNVLELLALCNSFVGLSLGLGEATSLASGMRVLPDRGRKRPLRLEVYAWHQRPYVTPISLVTGHWWQYFMLSYDCLMTVLCPVPSKFGKNGSCINDISMIINVSHV